MYGVGQPSEAGFTKLAEKIPKVKVSVILFSSLIMFPLYSKKSRHNLLRGIQKKPVAKEPVY